MIIQKEIGKRTLIDTPPCKNTPKPIAREFHRIWNGTIERSKYQTIYQHTKRGVNKEKETLQCSHFLSLSLMARSFPLLTIAGEPGEARSHQKYFTEHDNRVIPQTYGGWRDTVPTLSK